MLLLGTQKGNRTLLVIEDWRVLRYLAIFIFLIKYNLYGKYEIIGNSDEIWLKV